MNEDQTKPVFKVKETAENPLDTVIEKSNFTEELTLREIIGDIAYNDRILVELKAKRGVEAAKMANVEHFHPEVKDMPGEKLMACYLYQQSKVFVTECDKKIAQIEEAQASFKQEEAEIASQCGITIPTQAGAGTNSATVENNNDVENSQESDSKEAGAGE